MTAIFIATTDGLEPDAAMNFSQNFPHIVTVLSGVLLDLPFSNCRIISRCSWLIAAQLSKERSTARYRPRPSIELVQGTSLSYTPEVRSLVTPYYQRQIA